MRRRHALVLLAALAAAVPAARAATAPGEPIVLGAVAPLTGDVANAAEVRGLAAYLALVNARGGVGGRRIVLRVSDAGADPVAAGEAARALAEREGALALVGVTGDETLLAVRAALAGRGVPILFPAAAGAAWVGSGRAPSTVALGPSSVLEGRVVGRWLARTRGAPAVAVLRTDDAAGAELAAGLRDGLGPGGRVAAEVRLPAGVPPGPDDLLALRRSGARVLALLVADGAAALAARRAAALGWRPLLVVASRAAAAPLMLRARLPLRGAVSLAVFKDPTNPLWDGDPGLAQALRVLRTRTAGTDPADVRYVAGLAAGYALVDVLRAAGPRPSRQSVLAAARRLVEADNPFVLPGIVLRTGADDGVAIEQAGLQRWTGARWTAVGGLVEAAAIRPRG